MKKRIAKKIYRARRGRPDSPRLAFERGDWPWNRQTWQTACRVWWLRNTRSVRVTLRPRVYTQNECSQRRVLP
jgi:hypothetical protein